MNEVGAKTAIFAGYEWGENSDKITTTTTTTTNGGAMPIVLDVCAHGEINDFRSERQKFKPTSYLAPPALPARPT